jgi:hypothetical protein
VTHIIAILLLAGEFEAYRPPRPRSDVEIAAIGQCEAVLAEVSKTASATGAAQAAFALGRIRLWAGDPPATFRTATDQLAPDQPGRGAFVDAHRDECQRLGRRLE